METLKELDRDLLIFLNSLHTPWLDPIMFWITKTFFWLPLYLFLLYLIIIKYKKQSWIPLIGIALTILLADQITSGLMKPYFERLRPSREPSLEGILHIVNNYKGGKFGFASGHAANTFGTATFFFLLLRKRYKWIIYLFVWALVMTYTRIYLGVHYPGDILVGGTIGILCGWTGFKVQAYLDKRFNKIQAA
ncbi:phosphatase PAP2 family protein [Chryseotalea sanaruensis]|uniref:Phosphatase PAP2 family protein n=1 Tax=Chryseotalea sanaruensis TaxID=2482724 RepID=A0A401U6W0_9BACT|nr:phosphatase PAP2 family protein [Chryseotalea sanaruensis]GCC50643.1 phosphatase PAP2 family protein [Chryseotalea sanaruensis]